MDILIVIASAELSRIIGDMLRAEGHAVWEAADARTAFRALMSRLPDVVILDTKLPDIGGVDVLRAMRESPGGRGVTALLIAEDPLRTRWEARDLEPERILPKPLDVLDLADLVRELASREGDPAPGAAPARPPEPVAAVPPSVPAAQMAPPMRSIPPDRVAPAAPLPRPEAAPAPAPPRPAARTIPPGTMTWSPTSPSSPPASRPPAPARPAAAPTSHPPTAPDAWGVLGLPPGSSPEVIASTVERLVAHYSEAASHERSLDARARASSMVARVRAARRQLLGDTGSPPTVETE